MKNILILFFLCFSFFGNAQDATSLYASARDYMMKGNFDKASSTIDKALEADPNNLEIQKDRAYILYLKKDYGPAREAGEKIIERKDADVQSYQVLGLTYQAIAETKKAEKMYRNGIERFPASGVLYADYGNLLYENKNYKEAIKNWEAGIKADPNYSSNYYYAAKYYADNNDPLWSALYGEIFANIESFSKRTAEIKPILITDYKKMLQQPLASSGQNAFAKTVGALLDKNKKEGSQEINLATVSAIRTSFISEWSKKYTSTYPFRLFEYQQQLTRENVFNAYNAWLFSDEDSADYKSWVQLHSAEAEKFKALQGGRLFKVPLQQYYH